MGVNGCLVWENIYILRIFYCDNGFSDNLSSQDYR